MKKLMTLIGVLFLFSLVCGCSPYGSIYGVAADERGTGTIASDARITATIQKRFLEDKGANEATGVDVLDISVYCYQGRVYLVGEYDQERQKEQAVKIAGAVEGVKSVTPYLLPKKKDDTCGASDNLTIRTKLKAKLVADMDVWSTNVDFKVVQCHVVLLGVLGSEKEIARVVDHAKSVNGVRDVTSYLTAAK